MLRDVADGLPVEPYGIPDDDDLLADVEPYHLSDAAVARFDVLHELERRGMREDRLAIAELLLRQEFTEDELLTVPTGALAEAVERMIDEGATIEAEYDEDGFGHAWVEFEPRTAPSSERARNLPVTRPRPVARRHTLGRIRFRARRRRSSRSSCGAPSRESEPDPPPLARPRTAAEAA